MTLIKFSLNLSSRNHIPLSIYIPLTDLDFLPLSSFFPIISNSPKAAEDSSLDLTNGHRVQTSGRLKTTSCLNFISVPEP